MYFIYVAFYRIILSVNTIKLQISCQFKTYISKCKYSLFRFSGGKWTSLKFWASCVINAYLGGFINESDVRISKKIVLLTTL